MERQAGVTQRSSRGARSDSEKKWHVVLGHNQGACGVTLYPADRFTRRPALDVPMAKRCRRKPCREAWPCG